MAWIKTIPVSEATGVLKRHYEAAMGRAGKEHVRANYLTPRLLRDYLKLFTELKG